MSQFRKAISKNAQSAYSSKHFPVTGINNRSGGQSLAQISVKPITSKLQWENFISTRAEANFLHSWNWGEFHLSLGKSIHRIGFFQGENLAGVMLSIVEKARRATYLTVPGGPIIDWQDSTVIEKFKHEITSIAIREKCSFVRVRPQIKENEGSKKIFSDLEFKPSPMHLHAQLTHQLDLNKSTGELLANMRKSTRYEINRAQKLKVKVTKSQEPKLINNFYQLQLETAKRQKFVPFSKKFLQQQFEIFAADDQVALYTAMLGQVILTQAFIIFYNQEADYHYSASSKKSRKYPGSYAIQWQAIKDAKTRGMKRYNFWGVAPENQTSHRFYGVSVFKRGFRGQDVSYLPAQDLVINQPRYLLNLIIETIRKTTRKV